ncbi:MAG: endonuclease/exonuclease/phosphatase family protein, partial [Flavobacteriaceae bacterium]|nr:endonuclease/exonuclease/phosphatase family protein [Flavobacteriaceae bacterium]
ITPLEHNDYYIAVGDFNVGINAKHSQGSRVLENILSKSNSWIPRSKMNFTNEGASLSENPFRLMLDYIFTSKNITIKDGKIIHPDFSRRELGCESIKSHFKPEPGWVLKQYKNNDKLCHVLIKQEYHDFKMASDHYPIYGEFILK